jgi:hypothetical protein
MESVRVKLEQALSGVGRVSRMGPVQVAEVDEKPGALLVRWEEVWHVLSSQSVQQGSSILNMLNTRQKI